MSKTIRIEQTSQLTEENIPIEWSDWICFKECEGVSGAYTNEQQKYHFKGSLEIYRVLKASSHMVELTNWSKDDSIIFIVPTSRFLEAFRPSLQLRKR